MTVTEQFVVAPLVVALLGVVLTLVLRRRPLVQRAASLGGTVAYAAAVGLLAWRVVLAPDAPGAAAYQLGGWPAPFGITLVADALSAFMLVIAAAVGLAAVAASIRVVDRANQRVFYHPLFHGLLVGVTGSFLTGDLFNLFVWFEVMLLVSYVFVAFYGGPEHTAAAFRYLVLNVFGSAVFLLAVGGLYATVGTLNMADMVRRLSDPVAYGIDPAPVGGLTALLIGTFALKAGLVPFQFWVPGAYRAAPLPVAAMLAGVTKKVGMYAIVRLFFTVFGNAEAGVDLPWIPGASPLALLAPLLLAMGIASILVGGFGAVGGDTVDELLAYSSIGQVGFIAIPVAVAAATTSASLRRFGILAALVYALHHALAKTLLFLSAATIQGATGTNRLADLGGLAGRSPPLAGAFLVGSLSLIGVPPLTGFFGKLFVFEASIRRVVTTPGAGGMAGLAVLFLGALLTIAYTTRAWLGGFWGQAPPAVERARIDPAQVAVLVALSAVVVGVGLGFDPVYRFADAAATAAVDGSAYVETVDPAGGDPV